MQSASKIPHPLLWVPTGYFTMALMYNLLTSATVIMFNNLGMDNSTATVYAGMLGIAYTVKPFFAAFLEMFRTKKFFVILCQAIIGLGLIGVAAVMQMPNFILMMMIVFFTLSFVGSSQDITTDGVYITSLDGKRQAVFTGVQGLAWNLGKLVVLSAFVYLCGYLHEDVFHHDPHVNGRDWIPSWQIIFLICGAWSVLMAAWHYKTMPDGSKAENPPSNFRDAVGTIVDAFITFFQKKDIWLMVGFAFLFRLSYGFLSSPSILFMKDSFENGGLALTNKEFGLLYGAFGLSANVVGSLIGGFYVAKFGLQKVLFPLCLAVNVPNITFLFLSIYQPDNYWLISAGVVVEQFFFGIGAVGLMIYMMQQLSPGKYRTAHYAFGSALMGLCVTSTGMVSGTLEEWMGYKGYFVFVMVATIPSFIITWMAPFHQKVD